MRIREEDLDAGRAINHPPAFNRSQPAEWFAEIEEHFEELHIYSDAAKCDLLIDELDRDILQLIHNLELYSTDLAAGGQRYESLKGIILHSLFVNGL